MRILILLLFGALLIGCGSEPQMNVGSATELEQELERVKGQLSEERAETFQAAYETVMKEQMGSALAGALTGESPQDMADGLSSTVDGKTVSEIIAMADSMNQEKIADLESEIQQMQAAQKRLSGIEVAEARMRFPDNNFLNPRPVIQVANNTESPIERISFQAEWKSPDRPVPWWENEVTCIPDGGLKVEEEREMECVNSGISDPEQRENAELSVEVIRFQGPDGKPDVEINGSVAEKQATLDSLRSLFSE